MAVNVRQLYRISKAAAPDQPRITLVTGPNGGRYAAWPYGCVHVPGDLAQVADEADGTYRMHPNGPGVARPLTSFGPGLVRRKMLPLLDEQGREPAVLNPWMRQADDGDVHRLIDVPGGRVLVSEALLSVWVAALDPPMWRLTMSPHPIVWAATATSRASGLLLPIHPVFTFDPPEEP